MGIKLSSLLLAASILIPLLTAAFIGILATRPDLLQEARNRTLLGSNSSYLLIRGRRPKSTYR
ncbi:MAG: hypothetical protein QXJ64_05090 [Thermosphaera sp.]